MVGNEPAWPESQAGVDFCYVTTTGRRSGRPHTIEIWFVVHEGKLYLLSELRDRADWVRNVRREPAVRVRIGRGKVETHSGRARIVDAQAEPELDAKVRRLLVAKYEGWQEGQPLSAWSQAALPVEIAFPNEGGSA
jgi:deazaflavin-dependent oxidoreductase (nitroreductase family)